MRRIAAIVIAAGLSCGLVGSYMPAAQAQVASRAEIKAKRETASRMLRQVSISFDSQRLEDVMSFIEQLTGADMEVMWLDDRNPDGLDKDATISLTVKNVTALTLVEKVLAKAQQDALSGGNSWQMSDTGSIQIGPKSRLNSYRRIEIYDINDLLLEVPDYDNAPEFDLSQVLQSNQGGGGGGGQSPFQNTNDNDITIVPRSERAEDLKTLITELVEFDQWVDNGGDAATIRYWQGSFIVNAPDYVHRQIIGYSWWPSRRSSQTTATAERRWVTIDGRWGHSQIDGFAERAVGATAGGGGTGTGQPGGGG
ncbi:MAG: hypothetical protein KF902_03350 [Phycisphaeraceae bacterium]|nr:hypothetical protein [Phycisphaeraceae bacterium]